MATGTFANFKIYEPEFYTAFVDTVAQNLAAFGGASRNAIRVVPQIEGGHYLKYAFYDDPVTISRRNITDVSTAQTPTNMSMDDNIAVKVNRKVNLISMTKDSFKKRGLANEAAQREFSRVIGAAMGKKQVQDYLNTALIAVETAIQGNTAMNLDATATAATTCTFGNLQLVRALFGDAFGEIVTWVGHSRPYHDNQATALASGALVANVYGTMINEGNVPTLGLPFVVSDSSSLINGSGSSSTYNVLGLVPDAVIIYETEPIDVLVYEYGGNENIELRLQAEYAYNLMVKGFQWNISAGSSNPTDGTLGTTTNWVQVTASDKQTAGVRMLCNSAND